MRGLVLPALAAILIFAAAAALGAVEEDGIVSGKHGAGGMVSLLQEGQPEDKAAQNDDEQSEEPSEKTDEEQAASEPQEPDANEDPSEESSEANQQSQDQEEPSQPQERGEDEESSQNTPETESKDQVEAQQKLDQEGDEPEKGSTTTSAEKSSEEVETKPTEDNEEKEKEDEENPALANFYNKLTPESARMKIEEYARQAEDLVRNAPEEKREKVAGQVSRAVNQGALYEMQKMRDDQARRKHKSEFRKENLDGKLAKLAWKKDKLLEKDKQMAKDMNRTWTEEQQEMSQVKTATRAAEVSEVEHQDKKYVQWKEKFALRTSKKINVYQEAASDFRKKTAMETARFNKLKQQLKERKNDLKVRAAKERVNKEDAAKVKEQRVKVKEGLQKQDEKLSDDKLQEKINKKTMEAKANSAEGTGLSPEAKKAQDALEKVEGNLKFLNKDVATQVQEATQGALKAQSRMIKEREIASNRTKPNTTDVDVPEPNIDVPESKKKCGPGVLCSEYNRVVSATGGADKYFKLEMAELAKVKGDGEPTPEMEKQAYDALASRFGITGPKTEGTICGPGVPCGFYNKVMKEAGGSAKFNQEEASEVEKILKTQKDSGIDSPEATEAVKKQAFDKIVNRVGVTAEDVPAATPKRVLEEVSVRTER